MPFETGQIPMVPTLIRGNDSKGRAKLDTDEEGTVPEERRDPHGEV